jgi:phosphatidylglycerol:prolipoprotein diacylglycerol transferase
VIPELFHIGSFSVSPFGVLLVAAFLAAYWQVRKGLVATRLGGDDEAGAIVFAGGVGGIVGAKLYYALLYRDWHALVDRAGLVWYGGFLLGSLAVLWTLSRRDLLRWRAVDVIATALPLGYAVGRVGCFLVGDDYGAPTDGPWGVAFPRGLPPTEAGYLRAQFGLDIPASIPDSQLLRVHPTQLYETLAGLVIWALAARWLQRGSPPGRVTLFVLAALALERFAVEFLRAKDDRFLGPLTLAQALSLAVLGITALLAWRLARATAAGRSGTPEKDGDAA